MSNASHSSHTHSHTQTHTHTHTHTHTFPHRAIQQPSRVPRQSPPAESPSRGQLDSHISPRRDTHLFPFVTPSLTQIVNPDNQAGALIGRARAGGPTLQYECGALIGRPPSNRRHATRPLLPRCYKAEEVRPCGCCELSTLPSVRRQDLVAPYLTFFSHPISILGIYTPHATQHEGCRIYLRPEEQGRRRGRGALPVRAEPDHLQVQDPAAGRAGHRLPAGHEQLLQQAEGARAHAAHQQEGQQGGDPAARHRLHLGPAGGAGRAGEEPPALRRQRAPHAAHHPERRARQHLRGERMLR